MSVIGPRPQLVRDMVFMSNQQRMRHTAKPGLTGLAQVKGRNAVTWEEKLDWDGAYVDVFPLDYFTTEDHTRLKNRIAECNKSWIVTYDVCDLVKEL